MTDNPTRLFNAHRMAFGRRAMASLAVAGVLCGPGCERQGHIIPNSAPAEPRELFQPFRDATALAPSLVERPPYRLNVADVLEIIYQVKNIPTPKGYRLKIEDEIEIKFPFQKQFNQKLVVQSDGKVNCLLIGAQQAQNLTAEEVEAQLKAAYARYIREPELTVITTAANKKIDELKKAITTAPRGQSRLIPIKPDGTIDLPYVGEVMAYGKTVKELRSELNQRYIESDLEEVEVTVQTLEFAPRNVAVFGEVFAPGMQQMFTPTTVVGAIATAGGMNPRADTQHVLVVRRKFLPIPQAVIVDVYAMLNGKKAGPDGLMPNGEQFRYDFWLQDGDIIYVPPTGLAVATDWIDLVFTRGVRPIFPVTGNIGLNFGYDIYNAPSAFTSQTKGPPRINTQIGP
ncbi:MAG: polysaccharide biosynthesis/export family protein [Phycisphaerae bacterium]|nr:polysaccharide biosynthesis/export family protein [Phycisphaerae bacterium]